MKKIKIILLGNSAVGKTSIINQLIDHSFLEECTGSYSPNRYMKNIQLENKIFDLEIWDTVGKNKFLQSNYLFMKNTNICLLIYDVTNGNTFHELNSWYNFMNEINKDLNVNFFVIANKSDLYEDQDISKEEGERYAKSINASFYETSATDHECIEYLFYDIIKKYENIIKRKATIKKENDIDNKNKNMNKKQKIIKNYGNGDIYEGELNDNGKKNGFGKMDYNNGDKYTGNWKNDKREGEGIMEYKNRESYEGDWKNDMKNGKGKIKFNNKILNCEYRNDKREGNWIIQFKNNEDYIDVNFKDDIIIGEGKYYFKNKNKIIGILNEDYNIRKGKMENINGDIYYGEFDDNCNINGKGIMRYKDGLIYNGNWKKNIREGKGYLCSNDEDNEIINNNGRLFEEKKIKDIFNLKIKDYIFKGNFSNNEINGDGILYNKYSENILNNNTIFIGDFEKNIKKKGTIHFINGSYFEGYWKDDNNIDENKICKLKINELNEISKICNTDDWIKIINKGILNYYGNKMKKIPFTTNIK